MQQPKTEVRKERPCKISFNHSVDLILETITQTVSGRIRGKSIGNGITRLQQLNLHMSFRFSPNLLTFWKNLRNTISPTQSHSSKGLVPLPEPCQDY